MHELITELWREHGLTILMVTHDISEAFKLGTRVMAIDKRRHDPQAPHRYGSTAVYDFPLDKPSAVSRTRWRIWFRAWRSGRAEPARSAPGDVSPPAAEVR